MRLREILLLGELDEGRMGILCHLCCFSVKLQLSQNKKRYLKDGFRKIYGGN